MSNEKQQTSILRQAIFFLLECYRFLAMTSGGQSSNVAISLAFPQWHKPLFLSLNAIVPTVKVFRRRMLQGGLFLSVKQQ